MSTDQGLPVVIKFRTRVKRCERRTRIKRAWKIGEEVRTESEDLGWAILLEGSYEWLFVGEEEPGFAVGDVVQISIGKIDQR